MMNDDYPLRFPHLRLNRVMHLENDFYAEGPNFDLQIDKVDYWRKSGNSDLGVEFYCFVTMDEAVDVPKIYNLFTLIRMKVDE